MIAALPPIRRRAARLCARPRLPALPAAAGRRRPPRDAARQIRATRIEAPRPPWTAGWTRPSGSRRRGSATSPRASRWRAASPPAPRRSPSWWTAAACTWARGCAAPRPATCARSWPAATARATRSSWPSRWTRTTTAAPPTPSPSAPRGRASTTTTPPTPREAAATRSIPSGRRRRAWTPPGGRRRCASPSPSCASPPRRSRCGA